MAEKYRLIFKSAEASVWINIALAVGKLVTGILAMSFFICVNAVYNVGVAIAKKFAVNTNASIKNASLTRHEARKKIFKCYLIMGIVILVATSAFLIGSIRLFLGADNGQYTLVVALAIATFTFTELSISIVGFIRTRHQNKPLMEAVKLTTLASALISLALTQTALLAISAESNMTTYNGIGSIVFGILTGIIGVYMVLHALNILSGKYEKFLLAMAKPILKRYGFKAVKYDDDYATIYIIPLINNENLESTPLQQNGNIHAVFSNYTPQNEQYIPQNEQVDELDENAIDYSKNDFFINNNNLNYSIINKDKVLNENAMTQTKQDTTQTSTSNTSRLVMHKKSEVQNLTPAERFASAKHLINLRFRVDIVLKNSNDK